MQSQFFQVVQWQAHPSSLKSKQLYTPGRTNQAMFPGVHGHCDVSLRQLSSTVMCVGRAMCFSLLLRQVFQSRSKAGQCSCSGLVCVCFSLRVEQGSVARGEQCVCFSLVDGTSIFCVITLFFRRDRQGPCRDRVFFCRDRQGPSFQGFTFSITLKRSLRSLQNNTRSLHGPYTVPTQSLAKTMQLAARARVYASRQQ